MGAYSNLFFLFQFDRWVLSVKNFFPSAQQYSYHHLKQIEHSKVFFLEEKSRGGKHFLAEWDEDRPSSPVGNTLRIKFRRDCINHWTIELYNHLKSVDIPSLYSVTNLRQMLGECARLFPICLRGRLEGGFGGANRPKSPQAMLCGQGVWPLHLFHPLAPVISIYSGFFLSIWIRIHCRCDVDKTWHSNSRKRTRLSGYVQIVIYLIFRFLGSRRMASGRISYPLTLAISNEKHPRAIETNFFFQDGTHQREKPCSFASSLNVDASL